MKRVIKLQTPDWVVGMGAIISSIILGGHQPALAILVPRALYALIYESASVQCRTDAGACTCPQYSLIQRGLLTPSEAADQTRARYLWLNMTVVYCYLGLAGGFFFIGWLHRFSFIYMGNNLAERVRYLLLYRIMLQEVGFFDYPENSVGSLAGRL